MKYPKYEKYKDSDIKWIGMIPENWNLIRLKYLTSVQMGQSPDSDDYTDDIEQTPFLQGNAEFTDRFPVAKIYCESANKITNVGDILLSVRAPVGALNESDKKYGIGRGLCAIASTKIIKEYAWYLLHVIRTELYTKATGSTYEAVAISEVKNLISIHPSKQEQQSIANFLDKETTRLDALIARKQQLIETLKEKRIAIISHAVTKGLNPDASIKDSGIEWLDVIPKNWDEKPLKFVCTLNDKTLPETTDPEYEIKYVDIGSIDQNKGITKKEPYIFDEAPSRARRKVIHGDIIVSTVRTYLRAIAPVINPEENLIVSTGFAVIRPRKITSDYLSFLLRSKYFVEKVVSLSVGVSYPAINASVLGSIKIPIPSEDEQIQISTYLYQETQNIDNIIGLTEKHIDKLNEYKTALISAAVTGKIRVSE